MVGLIAAQHVVDQVGREGDLTARLLLARMLPLDQPADDRNFAEGAFEQRRIFDPVDEFIGQICRREKRGGIADRVQAPDRKGIIA